MRDLKWVAPAALALAAVSSGCLFDNTARIEREKRDADVSSRLVQVEDDLRRLQGTCQSLEGALNGARDADDRLQQRLARIERAQEEAAARAAAKPVAKPASKPVEKPVAAPGHPRAKPAEGESGDLMRIQGALKRAGYDPGPVDGRMGQKTRAALTAFQKDNALKADGVVGPQTLAKLQPYLSEPPESPVAP